MSSLAVSRSVRARTPVWYDVTDTLKSGRRTGIQRVVIELARELLADDRVHFVRFDPWSGRFKPLSDQERTRLVSSFSAADHGARPQPNQNRAFLWVWKRIKLPVIGVLIQPLVRALGLRSNHNLAGGVYLTAEILGDPLRAEAISRLHRQKKVALALVVHDIIPLTNPLWSSLESRDFQTHWSLAQKADILFANSQHTRSEVLSHRQSNRSPVIVCYPGHGSLDRVPPKAVRGVGMTGPFFASVGTVERRKNQVTLLRNFKTYRDQGGTASLVVAGRPGSGSEGFRKELETAVGAGYPVVWAEDADDAQVLWIYQNALATIFPSLGEGYGLPIIESIAQGTPCITAPGSSTGELAETFGGCLTVAPEDGQTMVETMLRFQKEPELRTRLSATIRSPLPNWAQYSSLILENLGDSLGLRASL